MRLNLDGMRAAVQGGKLRRFKTEARAVVCGGNYGGERRNLTTEQGGS